ncbi:MAG: DUF86 domain-containing protein [Candidatus Bipolaricaulota bacterium]
MKQSREYADCLADILEAAENAERFLGEMELDEFLADDKTNYAVVRALTIIGEAAKKIPSSARQQHPEIPWRAVAGMRDKVAHEYFGVDLRRVYETVRRELPQLRQVVKRMLQQTEREQEDPAAG